MAASRTVFPAVACIALLGCVRTAAAEGKERIEVQVNDSADHLTRHPTLLRMLQLAGFAATD